MINMLLVLVAIGYYLRYMKGSETVKNLPDSFRNFSVIRGTGITDDIAEACFQFLVDTALHHDLCVDNIARLHDEYTDADPETREDILYWDIFAMLDEIAPDGYYFGAHPGDGSDLGYWQIEEN